MNKIDCIQEQEFEKQNTEFWKWWDDLSDYDKENLTGR